MVDASTEGGAECEVAGALMGGKRGLDLHPQSLPVSEVVRGDLVKLFLLDLLGS